ncbi:MAG: hypothetical protein QM723_33440 [Myxococcaceae bacterium]
MARPDDIEGEDLEYVEEAPQYQPLELPDELSTGYGQALREASERVLAAGPFSAVEPAEEPPQTIKLLALPVIIFRA